MSFDSNAWYSLQNFGTYFFIDCLSVGDCVTATGSLADQELFQLATLNGGDPYYIRPKSIEADASGNAYCVNLNTGQPAIALCSNESAVWGIGNWTGQPSDGSYFYDTQIGDAQRLSLSDNETYSFQDYQGLSNDSLDSLRWWITSQAAINDQSYSTAPAAIIGGLATATTSTDSTPTSISSQTQSSSTASTASTVSTASTASEIISTDSTTSTASSVSSPSTISSPSTASAASTSNTASIVSTASAASTASSTSSTVSAVSSTQPPPTSTVIIVVTPTVTASPATASGASPTSSTSVNAATKSNPGTMIVLVLMTILPRLLLRL